MRRCMLPNAGFTHRSYKQLFGIFHPNYENHKCVESLDEIGSVWDVQQWRRANLEDYQTFRNIVNDNGSDWRMAPLNPMTKRNQRVMVMTVRMIIIVMMTITNLFSLQDVTGKNVNHGRKVWKISKEFKKKYGHCLVSWGYKPLGQWVTRTRLLRKKHKPTDEQIHILDETGFVWDVRQWIRANPEITKKSKDCK